MIKWKRVIDISPYVESEDYDSESSALVRRLYSEENKKYPILSISIHTDTYLSTQTRRLKGIHIDSSFKENSGGWWDGNGSYIPLELLKDLEEMIFEMKVRLLLQ
jgi:hypothetical protein